jgi:hypothetical protein
MAGPTRVMFQGKASVMLISPPAAAAKADQYRSLSNRLCPFNATLLLRDMQIGKSTQSMSFVYGTISFLRKRQYEFANFAIIFQKDRTVESTKKPW